MRKKTEKTPHKVNYIVTISDWNGHRTVKCYNVQAVEKAIGSRVFGGLYRVDSPTGKDTARFIPL